MANVLPAEKRLEVLAALVNGTSIRAASRMTDVHQDTIGRFAALVGEGCQRLHDRLVRDLNCPLVDLDEQHSWCGVREVHVNPAKHDTAKVGEQWTWAAICRTSKLTIAWHVGKRDQASADALVADVRARLLVMPQITTDGLGLYEAPIAVNFGPAVPYMQTIKNFSERPAITPEGEKFSVKRGVDFIKKRRVYGTPDPSKATTYAIERSNLTARQWNARLHRRTLSFSKKLDRHCAAVSLHYVHRNLCHIARNMRVTSAMSAGITDHVWTLAELMDAALAMMAEPAVEKPTPKPLVIPKPDTTARALPEGRGWLRVVGGSSGPSVPAAPAPPGEVRPIEPAFDETGQMDLLSWRAPVPAASPELAPPKGEPVQLSLFDEPPRE